MALIIFSSHELIFMLLRKLKEYTFFAVSVLFVILFQFLKLQKPKITLAYLTLFSLLPCEYEYLKEAN